MGKRKIAIIGVGKIARDQHVPAIAKGGDFELAAAVAPRGAPDLGVPVFQNAADLYRALPKVGLVAICTPPGPRHLIAREALLAGKDILLEKPPTTTISAFEDLVALSKREKRVLFQTWHARFNPAVTALRKLLKRGGVKSLRIDWRENVRKWHPGQNWVFAPGGFGVCDPGSNAISILTHILPFSVFVESASLSVPVNRQAPIAVELRFSSAQSPQPEIIASFDWLEAAGEVWNIAVETLAGDQFLLERGGAVLKRNGETLVSAPSEEYGHIYARFAALLDKRQSDMDGAPLRLLADAFLVAARHPVAEFDW